MRDEPGSELPCVCRIPENPRHTSAILDVYIVGEDASGGTMLPFLFSHIVSRSVFVNDSSRTCTPGCTRRRSGYPAAGQPGGSRTFRCGDFAHGLGAIGNRLIGASLALAAYPAARAIG